MVLQVHILADCIEDLSKGLEEQSVFTVVEALNVLFQVRDVSDNRENVGGVNDLLFKGLAVLSH
jgi:hypothetical protein